MNLTIERRFELLIKPNWSAKDIAEFNDCKTTKAYRIREIAIHQFSGSIKYLTSRVKVDSALRAMGSSLEQELRLIEAMKAIDLPKSLKTVSTH